MSHKPQNLPTDLAACHALIAELAGELNARDRRIRQLIHELSRLLRWRYGRKSEKVDENQLYFEALAIVTGGTKTKPDAEPESKPAEPASDEAKPTTRPGHGRKPLPKDLPRIRIVHELPPEKRICPHCQGQAFEFGEDTCERLEYVPASLQVIEDVTKKYACACGCGVFTAQKPMQPIEKGLPGPGLLAHVAVSKYADHLPLARQSGMLDRFGIRLSRSTLCDWMRSLADLLDPLYVLMKERMLRSGSLQTDDTPVPVFDPDCSRTRTGRLWTYVGDGTNPYTVYDYTPGRGREGPSKFLKSFHGKLQADAYAGYDHLYQDPDRGIIEVACWAHTRRYFFEALGSDPMRAAVMMAYIRLLYDIEREAKDRKLNSQARLALRQERAVPILDAIEAYVQAQLPHVLPKSPIREAFGYLLGNWDALRRYSQAGELEIDNNGAERALRGTAVGRKNWLFFGSDRGGQTAAVLSSVIATCKRHRAEPFVYLRDVIARISAHPASRLEELLPDRWQAARQVAITAGL